MWIRSGLLNELAGVLPDSLDFAGTGIPLQLNLLDIDLMCLVDVEISVAVLAHAVSLVDVDVQREDPCKHVKDGGDCHRGVECHRRVTKRGCYSTMQVLVFNS